jgi:hypothetical protein
VCLSLFGEGEGGHGLVMLDSLCGCLCCLGHGAALQKKSI